MPVDNNLQNVLGWQQHSGGNIGGVSPKLVMDQSFPPYAVFTVQGTQTPGQESADVDWYVERVMMTNTGHVSLSYDLMLDVNVATNAQAIERDLIVTYVDGVSKKNLTCNFSSQIVVASGWKLQISGADDGWKDTGFSIPLTPLVTHRFMNIYQFDVTKHTYGTQAVIVDGVYYPIPQNMQGLPAEARNWGQGVLFQFQQDLTPAAGNAGLGFGEQLTNANLTWW